MTVFKLYFKLLKRNYILALIYFGVFIFLTILTIQTDNSAQFSYSNTKTDIAFVDLDDTNVTRGLKEYLEAYANFKDIRQNQIEEALFYHDIKMYVEIPEGFTASLTEEEKINIKTKVIPDDAGMYSIQGIINKYANLASIYLNYDLVDEDKIVTSIKAELDKESTVSPHITVEEDYSGSLFFYNYMAYVIIALVVSIMGSIMLAFKPLEIKRRNHIASISDKKMNIILYICNFILGFIFLAILIGMSIILYPSSVLTSNGLLLMLNAFVFTLMIIALAYMLVTFFDSGNVISAIGTIFSLGFSFITGVFIPQYLLDENILRLAKVIPSYYYIQNNHRITELSNFQLSDLKDIGLNLLIQFIYALVFFIITLYISKKRQSQES